MGALLTESADTTGDVASGPFGVGNRSHRRSLCTSSTRQRSQVEHAGNWNDGDNQRTTISVEANHQGLEHHSRVESEYFGRLHPERVSRRIVVVAVNLVLDAMLVEKHDRGSGHDVSPPAPTAEA